MCKLSDGIFTVCYGNHSEGYTVKLMMQQFPFLMESKVVGEQTTVCVCGGGGGGGVLLYVYTRIPIL